jgi:hypothetical protein
MISNTKDLIDAELEGRVRQYTWRKAPSQASSTGVWFDTSMSPGNPPAQYYIGSVMTSTRLAQSTDGGLYHGANVSPSKKYLRSITTMTSTSTCLPMTLMVCDYLMFYPFIDMSVTDPQDMINNTTLPRWSDSKDLQMMAVLTNPNIGLQYFRVTYTNQDGVAGRVTPDVRMNSSTTAGCIITSHTNQNNTMGHPFMPLQSGDTGVRSIEQVTMLGGDTGLFAMVIVKPLIRTQIFETTAPYEKDCLLIGGDIPRIYDDAFLGMLVIPNGTISSTVLLGDIKVIWD